MYCSLLHTLVTGINIVIICIAVTLDCTSKLSLETKVVKSVMNLFEKVVNKVNFIYILN